MNIWLCVVLWVLSGVVTRLLCIWLAQHIHAESDGGGWDAGTTYRFYSGMPKQFSINYDGEFGAFGSLLGSNWRKRTAMWLVACLFAPVWWAGVLFALFIVVCWALRDNEDRSWKPGYERR